MPPAPDDPPLLPLAGIRVLDLADERAALGGRLLADLGAQVTLIEPPEGARSRGLAPFVDGRPGPDRSYQHLYFNANKQSRVVDLATPQGIAELRALAATADVLIETGAPGEMDGLGLGFADLRALNPQLIYVSATPYGQTGPRRDWKATDLTATAAGGLLHVTGDPADPPTHGAAFPAHTMTGLTVASSTMIALHGRDHAPGRPGAQLDISMQEATSFQLVQTGNPNTWLWRRQIPVRPGLSQALQCRDGRWVACNVAGNRLDTFLPLLDAAGIEHGLTPDDWQVIHQGGRAAWLSLENPLQYLAIELAARVTRDEFLQGFWDGGHPAMPTMNFPEMVESAHFRRAGQFHDVDAPAVGRPLSFSRSPLDPVQSPLPIKPAPQLGQHAADPPAAPAPAVAPPGGTRSNGAHVNGAMPHMPLEGIRVLDFCWVAAGPFGTRILANFGAEVIKVESGLRIDPLRNQPFHDGRYHPDLPDLFNDANTGKKSLTLDLTTERGKELIWELVPKVDVVSNNFSAGALTRMGFPYEKLREANPRLIVLHLPGVGGDSPWAPLRTLGNLLMAASGMNFLTGFPGRPPRGMGVAYPDFTTPHLTVASVLSALRARERDGQGREIELSQLSATTALVGAQWMQFAHTGEQPPLPGNRDLNLCPHGVYPAAGDDEWVALTVGDDAEWAAFAQAIGRPDLVAAPDFATHEARKANEDALDAIIAAWTAPQDRWAVAERLQAAGVAASAVENLRDMMEVDEAFRDHYQIIRQPSAPDIEIGIDGEPIRFAGEERRVLQRAPVLGEHNEPVLRGLLGLSQSEFDALVVEGVVA